LDDDEDEEDEIQNEELPDEKFHDARDSQAHPSKIVTVIIVPNATITKRCYKLQTERFQLVCAQQLPIAATIHDGSNESDAIPTAAVTPLPSATVARVDPSDGCKKQQPQVARLIIAITTTLITITILYAAVVALAIACPTHELRESVTHGYVQSAIPVPSTIAAP
jgi:hypothetical protein